MQLLIATLQLRQLRLEACHLGVASSLQRCMLGAIGIDLSLASREGGVGLNHRSNFRLVHLSHQLSECVSLLTRASMQ